MIPDVAKISPNLNFEFGQHGIFFRVFGKSEIYLYDSKIPSLQFYGAKLIKHFVF